MHLENTALVKELNDKVVRKENFIEQQQPEFFFKTGIMSWLILLLFSFCLCPFLYFTHISLQSLLQTILCR